MEGSDSIGKCVLIVEDNPFSMRLYGAMLAAKGYRVLQAIDGPRGVELARRELPDLIIMDINLPGMSGLDATRMLKEDPETADIPIIVTTAFGMRGDDPEILQSGSDGFVPKPVGVSEFLGTIEIIMERSRRLRPLPHRIMAKTGSA
jgi:two-component system cell cycle response regulator DivK